MEIEKKKIEVIELRHPDSLVKTIEGTEKGKQ